MSSAPYRYVFNDTFSSRRSGIALYVEKWGRSLLSHAILYAIFAIWALLSPLLVVAACVMGFLHGRGTKYLQSWGYLTLYVTFEVIGTFWITLTTVYAILSGSFPYSSRFKALHTRTATKWCAYLAILGHWIIGKRIFIRLPEGGIRSKTPVIICMRHVSTNDVVLSPFVFGWKLGFNLRMVMKKELLWDPFIEACGTRCDNYFIDRWNKHDMEMEVQGVSALMKTPYMDADGRFKGITIYPEGTRLTPAKRASVLASMEKAGSPYLDHARALRCTLPPRTRGLLSLMAASGDADLVFMGHVGYDDATTLFEVMRGDIFNYPLSIRMWRVPAEEWNTKDEAGRIAVILEKWKELDEVKS